MMAQGSGMEDLNSVDNGEGSFDEVEMALTGINMMLNNGFDEASALFDKYRYISCAFFFFFCPRLKLYSKFTCLF